MLLGPFVDSLIFEPLLTPPSPAKFGFMAPDSFDLVAPPVPAFATERSPLSFGSNARSATEGVRSSISQPTKANVMIASNQTTPPAARIGFALSCAE
jgi:hypothetical protein